MPKTLTAIHGLTYLVVHPEGPSPATVLREGWRGGFWQGFQGALSLSMALRMVRSLRMQATRATLPGLPAESSCS